MMSRRRLTHLRNQVLKYNGNVEKDEVEEKEEATEDVQAKVNY